MPRKPARASSPISEPGPARCYWTLQGNPDKYRAEDAVRDKVTDWWKTNGRRLNVGDRVIIWKAKGRKEPGSRRGVIGFGEVVNAPVRLSKAGDPYWIDPGK